MDQRADIPDHREIFFLCLPGGNLPEYVREVPCSLSAEHALLTGLLPGAVRQRRGQRSHAVFRAVDADEVPLAGQIHLE